jgi:hypothetical protein
MDYKSLSRKVIILEIFLLKKVFVPARLSGLVTLHGKISARLTGRPVRLSIDNPDVFWIVYGLSQVGSQLN